MLNAEPRPTIDLEAVAPQLSKGLRMLYYNGSTFEDNPPIDAIYQTVGCFPDNLRGQFDYLRLSLGGRDVSRDRALPYDYQKAMIEAATNHGLLIQPEEQIDTSRVLDITTEDDRRTRHDTVILLHLPTREELERHQAEFANFWQRTEGELSGVYPSVRLHGEGRYSRVYEVTDKSGPFAIKVYNTASFRPERVKAQRDHDARYLDKLVEITPKYLPQKDTGVLDLVTLPMEFVPGTPVLLYANQLATDLKDLHDFEISFRHKRVGDMTATVRRLIETAHAKDIALVDIKSDNFLYDPKRIYVPELQHPVCFVDVGYAQPATTELKRMDIRDFEILESQLAGPLHKLKYYMNKDK